jgi:hypothetical protein
MVDTAFLLHTLLTLVIVFSFVVVVDLMGGTCKGQ